MVAGTAKRLAAMRQLRQFVDGIFVDEAADDLGIAKHFHGASRESRDVRILNASVILCTLPRKPLNAERPPPG